MKTMLRTLGAWKMWGDHVTDSANLTTGSNRKDAEKRHWQHHSSK